MDPENENQSSHGIDGALRGILGQMEMKKLIDSMQQNDRAILIVEKDDKLWVFTLNASTMYVTHTMNTVLHGIFDT